MTFSNNSSQKERAAILKNEARLRNEQATTFHSFATSEADAVGGRWAKPTQITGNEGAVHMPRLPANSPWAQPDPTGQEAPFPIDINEPVVTGEAFEVEASLDADLGLQRTLRDGAPPPSGSSSPAPVGELAPGAEAKRADDPAFTKGHDHAARHSLPASGRHSINQRVGEGRMPPNPIKRRLI